MRRAKSFISAFIVSAFVASWVPAAGAGTAAFDLVGPKIDVRVQRAGLTLPIADVPNLLPGDRLWIHPDLPDSQSVKYLMVVVFLRGSTNPPPDAWFTRAETWTKAVHEEGIFVTVPQEAEEALIFLAPETGGAFSTLRNAVRGKPGAFVRAAQDLQQASLDRARLEAYLDAVRESPADPEQIKARTTLLARSLNIKLDQQCFDKPSAQQVPCLTQHSDDLVLDDQHSQNMVQTLTTGAPTDLLAQISSTPSARSGYYSPYIGAVVDVVRILGTTHTAQYQYIPALALPQKDELNLKLNNPPSFRNPKSVIVVGLPLVRPAVAPPLRAVDNNQVFCADKPELILPADSAPLVYATSLAHDFSLHVETKPGVGIDLPAKPDPSRGGFVIATSAIRDRRWEGEVSGVIRGTWGFAPFDGPKFRLRASRNGQWVIASKDASALIVGREDTLHLQSSDVCCVSGVVLETLSGKTTSLTWTTGKNDELELKVPLQNAAAGSVRVLIKKFGLSDPDEVLLHTYAEAGRLDTFTLHAGDSFGVLKGTRLDQVAGLDISGLQFSPESLSRSDQHDELRVTTKNSAAIANLVPGDPMLVRVSLRDGRTLELNASVDARRPRLSLLTKSVQETEPVPVIHMGNADELPQDARLNFFLKTQVPEIFSPDEKVEVATGDESFHVLLSVKDGNLTLQDTKTVFAVFDPMKLLGPSAFGPLKFRPVSGTGVEGEWQPLMNLVRVPDLKAVHCPKPTGKASSPEVAEKSGPKKTTEECTLSGEKLFLIDAVSTDADFSNSVTVPDGFVEPGLSIPAPQGKTLYIKLRDDPATVDTAEIPVLNSQP